jgi:hypothetical protein
MTSEQRAELLWSHANDRQDVSQGALGNVPPCVNWYGDCPPIRVLHHVVAASDPLDNESGVFERLDYLRSRYDRDAAWHKPGNYQKSGDVECQSQLVWWLNYIEQSFKRGAQVVDRLFLRRAVADRANARAKEGRGTPNAVFILLDDVGHVNDTSHTSIMHGNCCTEASVLTIPYRSFRTDDLALRPVLTDAR